MSSSYYSNILFQLNPSDFNLHTYVSINFLWGFVLGQLTIIFILTFILKYWLLNKSHSKNTKLRSPPASNSSVRQDYFTTNIQSILDSNCSYFENNTQSETPNWLNISFEYLINLINNNLTKDKIKTRINKYIDSKKDTYSYIKNLRVEHFDFYNNKVLKVDKIKVEKDQIASSLYLGTNIKINDFEVAIQFELNVKNIIKLPVRLKVIVYNVQCRLMVEPSICSSERDLFDGIMLSIDNNNTSEQRLELCLNTNINVGKNKLELNNNPRLNTIVKEIVNDIIYTKLVFPNSIKIPISI